MPIAGSIRYLLIGLITLACLNGLIAISSTWLFHQFAPQALKQSDLQVNPDAQVVLNVAAFSVSIRDLEVSGIDGTPVASIDKLDMDASWTGLLNNTIKLASVTSDNIKVFARKQGDTVLVGPDKSKAPSTEDNVEPSTSEKSSDWQLHLDTVDLHGTVIEIVENTEVTQVEVSEIRASDVELSGNEQQGRVFVSVGLGESSLDLSAAVHLVKGVGKGEFSVTSDGVTLSDFSSLLPLPDGVDGTFGLSLSPTLELGDGTAQLSLPEGEISLQQFVFDQSDLQASISNMVLALDNLTATYAPDGYEAGLVSMQLTTEPEIHIAQQLEKSEFSQQFSLKKLTLNNVSITPQNIATALELALQDQAFMVTEVKGNVSQSGESISGDIQTNVTELELVSFSPVIQQAVGLGFKSGQLDIVSSIKLDGSQLDGEVTLDLRGMEMNSVKDNGEENSLSGQAISLNSALSMLKDDNGNVELAIPVDGDMNNPNFGWHSFLNLLLKKAVMHQAKNYLMTTFVPYANIVSVALTGADYLLKVRVNTLEYDAGESELNKEQKAFLAELKTLMADKEDLQLMLCPSVTKADLVAISATDSSDKSLAEARKLGQSRGNSLKRYLVDELDVQSSRLLACSVDVQGDSEGAGSVSFTSN